MMLSRRLTRVFPQLLLCRPIPVSRVAGAECNFSSISSVESSSVGDSCSETEDEEAPSQTHQIQVLRAYLRNRRARCLSRVREQGLVPAVIVDPDKERRPKDGSTDVFISLDAKPLVSILKFMGKRDFVSRVFDMEIYRGPSSSQLQENLQVLPRNLNYGPGKTNILNIQFIRATPGKDLKLGVPLEFLGIDQCPGLRKGGTLKKLARYVVYSCKASELPAKLVVDMTVLEIGDRVLVQDLEVDFDHLYSDRTMPVCEIVKDVSSLKAKARKLKNELHFKRRAFAEKESTTQAQSLTDDEVEVSDDSEDEVIPYRYQKQRLTQKGSSAKKAKTKVDSAESDEETSNCTKAGAKKDHAKSLRSVELTKGVKPSKRRLAGAAFVVGKLNELAEKRTKLSGMKRQELKSLDHKIDIEFSSSSKKDRSVTGRAIEGAHGCRGQKEQRAAALGSTEHIVYDNFSSEDEDGIMRSHARKQAVPRAFARTTYSDSENDNETSSTSYISKATVRRRTSSVNDREEEWQSSSNLKKNKIFSDTDSDDDGERLPRYTKERSGKPKTCRKSALGA